MTKQELLEDAEDFLQVIMGEGETIATLPTYQLQNLMTVAQFLTDQCLNEIEERGELTFADGDSTRPIVPYTSDYHLDTILTRNRGDLNTSGHWRGTP